MNKKIQERFIYSAAVILFITGAAKLVSSLGAAETLDHPDSLLILSHRHILLLLSMVELGLSAFFLLGRNAKMKIALIAWLATNFLMYRVGLWWMGAPNLCNCLGNLRVESKEFDDPGTVGFGRPVLIFLPFFDGGVSNVETKQFRQFRHRKGEINPFLAKMRCIT